MDFTYDERADRRCATPSAACSARRTPTSRTAAARSADEPGFDEKLWSRLAEMGVLGLPFAEEDGGMGAGPVEVGIVAAGDRPGARARAVPDVGRARRRRWSPPPGTAEQRAEVLGALAGRRDRARLRARRARHPLGRVGRRRDRAAASGDDWTLSGVKEPVPHGARADLLVVSAALARRRHRAVPGRRRRRRADPDRLRDLRRRPRRPGGVRRHPRRPARRRPATPPRRPRAAARRRPDRRLPTRRSARWSSRSTRPRRSTSRPASSSASRSRRSRR